MNETVETKPIKQVADLKPGDRIYDIDSTEVRHYKYLCVHPTGRGKYHILINEYEEPFRIYGDKLQEILNKGFETHREAELGLANRWEQSAKRLREEPESL